MIYNISVDTSVAVNARSLTRSITGVERYAREVSVRFKSRARFLAPAKNLPGPAGHLWEQVMLPAKLHRGEILWSPANSGPLAVSRQVLTLHDISFMDHPEWFNPSFTTWYRALIPQLVHRVAMILTVSSFSKIRIVDAFQISPERVKVIPGGVDPGHFWPVGPKKEELVRRKFGLDHPYILAVGSLGVRKNLDRLIQAWQLTRGDFPDLGLAIVGTAGAAFRRVNLHETPAGIRLFGRVEDDELAALYSASAAYILPSLYEGFGLTALEAMACGAPVIAAGAGALPEVVGSAGLLIDPWDSESIGQAICRVLEDSDLRQGMIQRGLRRAREASWDLTAAGVWTSIQFAASYSG